MRACSRTIAGWLDADSILLYLSGNGQFPTFVHPPDRALERLLQSEICQMAYTGNSAIGGVGKLGNLICLLGRVPLFPLGIQAPKSLGILIAKQHPFSPNHLFDHEHDLAIFGSRHPERMPVLQVVFFKEKPTADPVAPPELMKRKIDSEHGREQYGRRLATVEPVFGNITYNKRLRRFSLRGWLKVNVQWKLYCIVHNLLKIHRYGFSMIPT